jgi:hypothetical protein
VENPKNTQDEVRNEILHNNPTTTQKHHPTTTQKHRPNLQVPEKVRP